MRAKEVQSKPCWMLSRKTKTLLKHLRLFKTKEVVLIRQMWNLSFADWGVMTLTILWSSEKTWRVFGTRTAWSSIFKSNATPNGRRSSKLTSIQSSKKKSKWKIIWLNAWPNTKRGLREWTNIWNLVTPLISNAKRTFNNAFRSIPKKCKKEITRYRFLSRNLLIWRVQSSASTRKSTTNLTIRVAGKSKLTSATISRIWKPACPGWWTWEGLRTAMTRTSLTLRTIWLTFTKRLLSTS